MLRPIAVVVLVAAVGELSCAAVSVSFEAESGALGSDWAVSNSSSPAYITITTTNLNNPGSSNRVAAYSVVFPAAGTYQLYAHGFVGAGICPNG